MKHMLSVLAVWLAFGAAAPAADISGKWQAVTQEPDTGQVTFAFIVSGGKLTGTVTSGSGSWEISDGKTSGEDVSFLLAGNYEGQGFKAAFKGKLSGGQINFTVSLGEGRTFEMIAKKVS